MYQVEKWVFRSERFWLLTKLKYHKIVYVASFACVIVATYNVHVFKLDEYILLRPMVSYVVPVHVALSCTQKLVVAFTALRAIFVVFQNDVVESVTFFASEQTRERREEEHVDNVRYRGAQ